MLRGGPTHKFAKARRREEAARPLREGGNCLDEGRWRGLGITRRLLFALPDRLADRCRRRDDLYLQGLQSVVAGGGE